MKDAQICKTSAHMLNALQKICKHIPLLSTAQKLAHAEDNLLTYFGI